MYYNREIFYTFPPIVHFGLEAGIAKRLLNYTLQLRNVDLG
jgi:hypothetical protein